MSPHLPTQKLVNSLAPQKKMAPKEVVPLLPQNGISLSEDTTLVPMMGDTSQKGQPHGTTIIACVEVKVAGQIMDGHPTS